MNRERALMKTELTDLIAAPFTPMHADGGLNLDLIELQAQSLVANSVPGAFICGTTGEGLSLTTAERIQVAQRWMAAAPRQLKLIVHVGHNNIEESRRLAAHAEEIGAHAFATIGPSFFRPDNVGELVDFCERVAAGAPGLPFYFYHIPAITGIDLPMIDFLKLAGRRIPNFAGVKFTDENLMSFSQCLNFEDGRYNILFGRDEILLAALALGAKGAVGSTYNFMAPLFHKLTAAFQAGDLAAARRHQSTAVDIIAVMNRHGGLPVGKAMMKLVGLDCGPARPPLRNPASEEWKLIERELARAGFPLNEPERGAGRDGERSIEQLA